jgi:hypothetical protein
MTSLLRIQIKNNMNLEDSLTISSNYNKTFDYIMNEIYMDLAENEDNPLIRELIPNMVCYCRYMNDVSNGAMLIKEKHRQLKEK